MVNELLVFSAPYMATKLKAKGIFFSTTDLEGSGNGGGDLVELFPGVVSGGPKGCEQVVQAQQRQQQQSGS